jgi:hypothetical protein
MTKVATIDARRVLHIVVIAAMMIATLLAALIPTVVSAADNPADNEGTTGGSFSTNDSSSPPLVNSVDLTDNASVSATAMDPQTEYYVEVSVTDNQTLEHLTSVELTIWYDADGDHTPVPTSVDNQTCAIITWTPANTWTLAAMGAGSTWSITNGTTPTLTNNTGTFIFHFTPGKVATENAGSDDWDITAVATDSALGADDESQTGLDMNWRGEINSVSASVNFGSVSLGAQDLSSALTATYICNGDYSEQAKTDAQWVNVGYTIDLENSGAPGDNHFRLDVNDESNSAPETQLTNAYVDIDNNETITSENGVTNASIYLWLTLGTSGVPSGTYTGDINFAISTR